MKRLIKRLLADYGMIVALLLLCLFFSLATITEQKLVGEKAAKNVWEKIAAEHPKFVLVVSGESNDEQAFANSFDQDLIGMTKVERVSGTPQTLRAKLDGMSPAPPGEADDLPLPDAIMLSPDAATWKIIDGFEEKFPPLRQVRLVTPSAYRWPNFLKTENLVNITNQIVVIAIIAIGMTLVIITSGIDLSVGSLIALSAVIAASSIRDWAGGVEASIFGMVFFSLFAILVCGAVGLVSGVVITRLRVPPFIATLGMMLIGSGVALQIANGQSIDQIPSKYTWLGRGLTFHIPNAVWLMLGLYLIAHLMMTQTAFGRTVYAVGGNSEAARLSGINVNRVILIVYFICGLLAGLGGIIMASQLRSAGPTYGQMYELYVIAAVVVGGTSLQGGEGKVLGTLIGALIIAVIQNGMNLMGVGIYSQKIVLGALILIALGFDNWKKGGRG